MNTIDPADIDDQCPPAECVVRLDLADDAETPPKYCESCPLPECEWKEGRAMCPGLRGPRRKYLKDALQYYSRNWNRAYRAKIKVETP